MVFGDNVRARKAARALPRTPQQEEEGRGRGQRGQATRTAHPSSTALPPPTQTITAIPQWHNP